MDKLMMELDLLRRERAGFIRQVERLKKDLRLALGNMACYRQKISPPRTRRVLRG